jgi:hypothetical protein
MLIGFSNICRLLPSITQNTSTHGAAERNYPLTAFRRRKQRRREHSTRKTCQIAKFIIAVFPSTKVYLFSADYLPHWFGEKRSPFSISCVIQWCQVNDKRLATGFEHRERHIPDTLQLTESSDN